MSWSSFTSETDFKIITVGSGNGYSQETNTSYTWNSSNGGLKWRTGNTDGEMFIFVRKNTGNQAARRKNLEQMYWEYLRTNNYHYIIPFFRWQAHSGTTDVNALVSTDFTGASADGYYIVNSGFGYRSLHRGYIQPTNIYANKLFPFGSALVGAKTNVGGTGRFMFKHRVWDDGSDVAFDFLSATSLSADLSSDTNWNRDNTFLDDASALQIVGFSGFILLTGSGNDTLSIEWVIDNFKDKALVE